MSPPLKKFNKESLPIRPPLGPDGLPVLNDPTDVLEPGFVGQVTPVDDGLGSHREEDV